MAKNCKSKAELELQNHKLHRQVQADSRAIATLVMDYDRVSKERKALVDANNAVESELKQLKALVKRLEYESRLKSDLNVDLQRKLNEWPTTWTGTIWCEARSWIEIDVRGNVSLSNQI